MVVACMKSYKLFIQNKRVKKSFFGVTAKHLCVEGQIMNVRSLLSSRRWQDASRQPGFSRFSLLNVGAVTLLFTMVILLSACSNPFQPPAQSGTPEPNTGNIDPPTFIVSPTTTPLAPAISFQAIGCPSTLSINWDKLTGTKAGINKVQKATCGTFENGALAAL